MVLCEILSQLLQLPMEPPRSQDAPGSWWQVTDYLSLTPTRASLFSISSDLGCSSALLPFTGQCLDLSGEQWVLLSPGLSGGWWPGTGHVESGIDDSYTGCSVACWAVKVRTPVCLD